MTANKHFWNGWDFKTFITYALIVGGFVVTQVRSDERMNNAIEYLSKEVKDVKETTKEVWKKISLIDDAVKRAESTNEHQQKEIDKHDRKLYPNN